MDIETAIEVLVKNQAKMDARFNAKFDRADKRMERMEKVVAQSSRLVARPARIGLALRGDVRKTRDEMHQFRAQTEKNLARITESLSETDDMLNGLVDIVDRHLHGNGKER